MVVGLLRQWLRVLRPLGKTSANLWRRRVTRSYPRAITRTRIQPALVFDEGGRHKCVACHLCESACPTDCIYIEAEPSAEENREKQPRIAELDLGRCLFCGQCVIACPEGALQLAPRTKLVDRLRLDLVQGPSTGT